MAALRLPLQFMREPFRLPAKMALPILASVFLAILAAVLALGFKYLNRSDRSESYLQVHRGHLVRLDANSAEARVVFLGSSTFQALDVSRVTPSGLNLAAGGELMSDLIQRAKTYHSVKSARVVVLNSGFNDLFRSCDGTPVPIDDLLSVVPTSTPVIVVGLQGISAKSLPARCKASFPSLIAQQNQLFVEACKRRSRCLYLQNPVPAKVEQSVSDVLQEPDGIHLSGTGYTELVNALAIALRQLADSPP
jgi:hypothetical protein